MRALILLNPHAAAGRAEQRFAAYKPLLPDYLEASRVAITPQPTAILPALREAADAGFDTVLALGGDGTNLAVVNALAALPDHPFTFATLPLGTGQDWARTIGIPRQPEAALRWLRAAARRPIDLGHVTIGGKARRFVNVASAGLSGVVANYVEQAPRKRPWTFLEATLSALFRSAPPAMRVLVAGEVWYEGPAFLLAVGNGRAFGRGMMVCPDARIDDGLFDVVLIEGMGRGAALRALPTLFSGSHLALPQSHHCRAREVRVEPLGAGPLLAELDGDPTQGIALTFTLLPKALPMWVDPQAAIFQQKDPAA